MRQHQVSRPRLTFAIVTCGLAWLSLASAAGARSRLRRGHAVRRGRDPARRC